MNDRESSRRYPLALRPRSLREACVQIGLDDDGDRCCDCPLRELCEDESRWLLRRRHLPAAKLH